MFHLFLFASPPVHRRVSSRRSRTPPPNRRRSPISGRRVRSRSRSPPRYGRTGSVSQSRDAREIIRREMEKRSGHGGDPFLRERERQVRMSGSYVLFDAHHGFLLLCAYMVVAGLLIRDVVTQLYTFSIFID